MNTTTIGTVYGKFLQSSSLAPGRQTKIDTQAEAILKKAIQNLGGNNYLQVKTQIGRGKFSVIREGAVVSFSRLPT